MIIKTLLAIAGLGLLCFPMNTLAVLGGRRPDQDCFTIDEQPVNRKHIRILAKFGRSK